MKSAFTMRNNVATVSLVTSHRYYNCIKRNAITAWISAHQRTGSRTDSRLLGFNARRSVSNEAWQ